MEEVSNLCRQEVALSQINSGPGFAIGAFFSLMSASFAYEDPLLRQQSQASLNNAQKAREIFKEMGRGMWRSGKGFGKVGALFSGIECVIESVCRRLFTFNVACIPTPVLCAQ